MTELPMTKAVAVLSASPLHRARVLTALAENMAAFGVRTVSVSDPNLGVPTMDALRRVDWASTFDTTIDLCALERRTLFSASTASVVLSACSALHALAWYRASLVLREDEFDDTIRSWLEGPALAAARGYSVLLHVRPADPTDGAECLIDQQLSAVLGHPDLQGHLVLDVPEKSDIGHCALEVATLLCPDFPTGLKGKERGSNRR